MECNKDEATRAKELAEKKFIAKDINGAKKFALKAQNLYPGLDGIPQMIATLNVYISAENKINGEADWYAVLGVNPLADDESVRKQYRKLALMLHPDKNKSIGAEGAFKLISEAWSLLSDKGRRAAYDKRRYAKVTQTVPSVEEFKQEPGPHGKLVYKYKLVRIPGQPELTWKVVKKSKVREGLCVHDISLGKEVIPISAINTIDSEKPPPFEYVCHMIYPDWCCPIPPKGCGCTKGCSELGKCSCVMKNEGEIPYNHNGAIVEAKPLVYECGPNCNCPPSCYNRVSQHGIKIQLEIFKTESRGWGVRSLNSISSGTFICEYAGELLEDREAEERKGNDEYLFDIGNNIDSSLWDGLSNLLPDAHSSSCQVVHESGFTIDAARCGNIGRFINHSCSPNLYAQNVLYDHEDMRIPHIMFFAAENIPPLQELTYHYNYMIDQVRDENGNIKKKICYCGSSECTGRLY